MEKFHENPVRKDSSKKEISDKIDASLVQNQQAITMKTLKGLYGNIELHQIFQIGKAFENGFVYYGGELKDVKGFYLMNKAKLGKNTKIKPIYMVPAYMYDLQNNQIILRGSKKKDDNHNDLEEYNNYNELTGKILTKLTYNLMAYSSEDSLALRGNITRETYDKTTEELKQIIKKSPLVVYTPFDMTSEEALNLYIHNFMEVCICFNIELEERPKILKLFMGDFAALEKTRMNLLSLISYLHEEKLNEQEEKDE